MRLQLDNQLGRATKAKSRIRSLLSIASDAIAVYVDSKDLARGGSKIIDAGISPVPDDG